MKRPCYVSYISVIFLEHHNYHIETWVSFSIYDDLGGTEVFENYEFINESYCGQLWVWHIVCGLTCDGLSLVNRLYSEIDQTYLSIEAQCVSHHYPRWTATSLNLGYVPISINYYHRFHGLTHDIYGAHMDCVWWWFTENWRYSYCSQWDTTWCVCRFQSPLSLNRANQQHGGYRWHESYRMLVQTYNNRWWCEQWRLQLKSLNYGHNKMRINWKISKIFRKGPYWKRN